MWLDMLCPAMPPTLPPKQLVKLTYLAVTDLLFLRSYFTLPLPFSCLFSGRPLGAKRSPPRRPPRRTVSSPGEAAGARGALRGRRAGRSRGAAVREVSSGAQEIPPAPRPVFALRAEKGAERLQRPSRACRTPRG